MNTMGLIESAAYGLTLLGRSKTDAMREAMSRAADAEKRYWTHGNGIPEMSAALRNEYAHANKVHGKQPSHSI